MINATVIGSGPNGLAAAIVLARQGLSVTVYEAWDTVGGGTRTKELTRPGFLHDVCSAIHPMAAVSPFLKTLPLEDHGLTWIHPEYPLAHPLEGEPAAVMHHSLPKTAEQLGEDEQQYLSLFENTVYNWNTLAPRILGPISMSYRSPILMARFGLKAIQSAVRIADSTFNTDRGRALFGGLAAHSILPLDNMATSAIGLVLGAAGHHVGWPFPKGGSQAITEAMASYLKSLGGEIKTGMKIATLDDLPESNSVFFNTTPAQILRIAGDAIPHRYARKLNSFRYGSGVFKIDLALDGPVPWRDPECRKAGTVHVGGTFEEIKKSEACLKENRHPEKPFVLVAQQSLFDETRAPEGKHTLWAYCHVPNGSTKDMTGPILNQIDRFAPGIRDRIIDKHCMDTTFLENYNSNYVGGDINGGRQNITQLFTRPAGLLDPYHIPGTNLFISSSSTPPGGGVHGMCGYHAARSALRKVFKNI